MKTMRCSMLFLLLAFPCFLTTEALAQKAAPQKSQPVKCASCHKTTNILPASHKSYSLQATGKCFECHKVDGKAKPLGEPVHTAHLKKSPETMKNCFACHTAGKGGEVTFPGRPGMKASKDAMPGLFKYFDSWMNSGQLDASHRGNGVYCLDCHTDYVDEYAAGDTKAGCTGCHGSDAEMAKKTAVTKYSQNPHKSHYVDLKCSACHHSHKPFEDFCAQCHPFGFKAPQPKGAKPQ